MKNPFSWLDSIPKFLRVILILAGYLAALAGAFIACWINDNFLLPADVRNSGMAAGGDMVLFLGVTVFLSIPSTALALFYLRSYTPLWTFFSMASIVLALTGLLWMVIDPFFNFRGRPDAPVAWMILVSLMTIRWLGAPVLAVGDGAFALVAPNPKARWTLLAAGVMECLITLVAYFCLYVLHRMP